MAGPRAKSPSRRRSGKRSPGNSLLPWVVTLAVAAGGIGLYENSKDVRRFISGLTPDKPAQVWAKPTAASQKSTEAKAPAAVPQRGPVPPQPLPLDRNQTAAIAPPSPVGRPGETARPAVEKAPSAEVLAGAYQAKFFLCGTAKQDDCVVSADRFVLHGQKIRLVGIEVPDIKKPRCENERIKASDAELRVRAFLDSGPFEIVTWPGNDAEVDGHRLREVRRNGMSLSDILVREGLAKRPGSGGKGGWC